MVNTTVNSDAAWRPDIHTFAPEEVLKDSLYHSATTFSGTVEGDAPSVRVAFVKDADSAAFVAEGAEISDRNERRKRGLGEPRRMPKLEDEAARANTYISNDAD